MNKIKIKLYGSLAIKLFVLLTRKEQIRNATQWYYFTILLLNLYYFIILNEFNRFIKKKTKYYFQQLIIYYKPYKYKLAATIRLYSTAALMMYKFERASQGICSDQPTANSTLLVLFCICEICWRYILQCCVTAYGILTFACVCKLVITFLFKIYRSLQKGVYGWKALVESKSCSHPTNCKCR